MKVSKIETLRLWEFPNLLLVSLGETDGPGLGNSLLSDLCQRPNVHLLIS